ncbi:penicillin-binding transpeptidase domain-containing protein [Oceanobacillus luteolus]|uniref:serine-type D-Ala-D-Ala carboxypeptidase n=1 Tax=Oceanobacillus luteolus TaxID=1274358 RepID=A0ABW4HPA3_9BACI|nr:penicillin-binding transpeptidase domain-containing protein [Oceanobacillus luteolus]MCM3740252.1 penicillin-binding transpeptidase domain-containing protein [Oceanobacillus luteolus]
MKRVIFLLVALLLLAACSEKEQVTPNERFKEFASIWSKQEFDQMFNMFSTETKEKITEEESIQRYEKIYNDLSIENVHISFDELTEEELDELKKEENPSVTLPFTVEMDSFAGPISFEYEATLVQELVNEEEDEYNWFVNWDAGFIHPELVDGGEIGIETIEPVRGEILDRNQIPLAINDTVYQIGIKPEDLVNPEQAKQQIADILNIKKEKIDDALSAGWVQDDLFVPIATILPTDEAYEQVMAIPGVQRKEMTGRIYPGEEATAHLVGYIGDITAEKLEELESDEYGPNDKIGIRGLESWYEERLKGKRGVKIFIKKEDSEDVVIAEKPVENGETIQLTIDINIQEKIYNSYKDDSGTTAAIDPKTGETLALVSAPAFDPNEVLYGTSGDAWDDPNDQDPSLNRFAATFAPGSVLKPITAAAGINIGTLDPEEGFEIEGKHWSKGKGWGDYQVTRVSLSNGPVDLKDALVRSDNIYFAMQALEMGSEAFIEEFKQFGFEEDFPYEYPIPASTISSTGEINDEVLLANSSYGQGELEMSALHLATAYTVFLNGGDMLKPTLLLSEDTGQIWKEDLLSEEEVKRMQSILRAVVTDGTAKRAEEESNVPIAGKTGTVELKLSAETGGAENSWFVAYPHESPDILMAMLVEETEDKESGLAIGKFVEVINQLYPEKNDE